jgi:sarcosine oxidase subunit gamma
MFERRSALARFPLAGTVRGETVRGGARVRLSEVRAWHLAQLTAFGADDERFRQLLARNFGAAPPADLYRGVTGADSRLIRLTRQQYWWIAGEDGALGRFTQELPPAAGAVTRLSAGRVRLCVDGPAARDLLARGIAIDLHPAAFAVGHSAQTGLHHTGILLERVADESYELFVPRSYAAAIWEWLVDAALPYGADHS